MSEFLTHSHKTTPISRKADNTPNDLLNDTNINEFLNEWNIDKTIQSKGGLLKEQTVIESERKIYLLQRKKSKMGSNLGKTTGKIS